MNIVFLRAHAMSKIIREARQPLSILGYNEKA
jgi:hypothetical protein